MTLTQIQRVKILYKTILKLHRGLPPELKILGDSYTREEFKRHKKCTLAESEIFISEWSSYTLTLAEQLGLRGPGTAKPLGKSLLETDLNQMRDEQVHQLYELMLAATSVNNNNKE